jgi:hypothetical protein
MLIDSALPRLTCLVLMIHSFFGSVPAKLPVSGMSSNVAANAMWIGSDADFLCRRLSSRQSIPL